MPLCSRIIIFIAVLSEWAKAMATHGSAAFDELSRLHNEVDIVN